MTSGARPASLSDEGIDDTFVSVDCGYAGFGAECVTRNLHAPLGRPATLAALAMGAIMSKRTHTQAEPWTESDVAELQAFVAEEMSVDEMAEELGRSVA